MKYDRLWQNTPEDLRTLELYEKISKTVMQPGMAKVVDQPLIEVPEGTEGAKTVTLNSGERVTYMDNGLVLSIQKIINFLGHSNLNGLVALLLHLSIKTGS